MKIKKNKEIPFAQPLINTNISSKLIKKVLIQNFPNEGNYTKNFEKKLSHLLKVKYAVTATSGTSSIFLALKASGINNKDEVIVPNITFPATANAVKLSGAKVILADIDKENLLFDGDDSLFKEIIRETNL